MTLLSKSKYLYGLQCLKYLWKLLHEGEKFSEVDEVTEFTFEMGHKVGQLAKQLYHNGIDIPEADFKKNLELTKKNLDKRKPLFEPAFMVGNIYSRADILVPVGKNQWDIIEVKSGTKVKPVNIHDVSFQKHVYQKAGLNIRNCYLLHVNNEYVKDGDINLKEFFTKEDITTEVEEAMIGIQDRIIEMIEVIKNDICPKVEISRNCADPYDCPVEDECWGFLPECSVFDLYRGGKKSFQLFEDGVHAIIDIPDNFLLTNHQEIQLKCEKEGKLHLEKDKIKLFLDKLKYPIYYLDFETIASAIPVYDGMKPYQKVPFQFSLHIDDGKSVKHHSFLASGSEDPRADFLKELKKLLGDSSSIVVYNQSFEQGVLRELAEEYPNYKEWVDKTNKRMVDLIVPFRNFYYYNPKQKGSASLKYVLPAICGKDYSHLDIDNGQLASVKFYNITFNEEKKANKIRKDLEKYCKLDTEAMVWIVEELRKIE